MQKSTCLACGKSIYKKKGEPWEHEPPIPRHIAEPEKRYPRNATMSAVCNEVDRARHLFPEGKHQTVALMEEVGELSQALLENESPERIREEAIQVAAMAIRVAEEGDADFRHSQSPNTGDSPSL